MSTTIGSIIAELRKAKGATQEELGSAVGVSAQAVSKWETGGTPDIELLPAIADYFDVSIDSLFGRDTADRLDIGKLVVSHISSFRHSERIAEVYRICSYLHLGIFGCNDDLEQCDENHSQVVLNEGISLMHLSRKTPYYFVAPENDNNWNTLAENSDELLRFFEQLANRDVLDALILCYSRDFCAFTGELFVKRLGISKERAEEIIELFESYGLIRCEELELNDERLRISKFYPNPVFIPFLIFARELISQPNVFRNYWSERRKRFI